MFLDSIQNLNFYCFFLKEKNETTEFSCEIQLKHVKLLFQKVILGDTATSPPFTLPCALHICKNNVLFYCIFGLSCAVASSYKYLNENVELWHSSEVCSRCSIPAAPSLKIILYIANNTDSMAMHVRGKTRNQQKCQTSLKLQVVWDRQWL